MAKKYKQPDAVTIRYDLHELPTAQHKAGLAGLLLQIDSIAERVEHGALPRDTPLVAVTARCPTSAELCFTSASVQVLFDDLYAAKSVEKWTPTWDAKREKKPKRVEVVEVTDKKGKKSKQKRHFYDDAEPLGLFLWSFTDGGKEIWHKLWRDMLWAIPRAKPTTRGPFNARAEDKPTKEGTDAWGDLLGHDTAIKQGTLKAVEVAGAIRLGAQAANAERIQFQDRADYALLLHFWQLTARVFVPAQIGQDEKTKEWRQQFVGYVLAIPDISDVDQFAFAYKRGLSQLSPKKHDYRPAEAVISLAAEGALAFMHQLDRLASAKVLGRRPPEYLTGIEFFHFIDRDAKGKKLRDTKIATHGRVPAWDGLLTRYDGLVSKGGPKNPLILAGRLRALLDGQPWFAALADDLVEREWSWFTHSTKEGHRTPPAMVGFAWEAAAQFETIERNYQMMADELAQQESASNVRANPPAAEVVDRVIYRLVEQFVVRKARSRMGVPEDAPWQSEHTHRRVPGRDGGPERWQETSDYQDHRRHVASGLFLALRSRRGEDFVGHFTAALGAVSQYLPPDEYILLAAALMRPFTHDVDEHRARTRDDVKTLTLLALSAHSRSLTAKQQVANAESGNTGEESAS